MYIFIAWFFCGILPTTWGSSDETTVSTKLLSGKATTNEEVQFIILANEPSSQPTPIPTAVPIVLRTATPTRRTRRPTGQPSLDPTEFPTFSPTGPSHRPTLLPTKTPNSRRPTRPKPTQRPSPINLWLTKQPTSRPTCQPSYPWQWSPYIFARLLQHGIPQGEPRHSNRLTSLGRTGYQANQHLGPHLFQVMQTGSLR